MDNTKTEKEDLKMSSELIADSIEVAIKEITKIFDGKVPNEKYRKTIIEMVCEKHGINPVHITTIIGIKKPQPEIMINL